MVGPVSPSEIPLKKPVFYLKFDSPNPKAPQDHACAEVNIRYCPLMLSICLLNFLSGGFGGQTQVTGLGGEHIYSVSHLTRLLHLLRIYIGPGADQSGLAREQGQGSSCLMSSLVLGLQEHSRVSSFSRVLES